MLFGKTLVHLKNYSYIRKTMREKISFHAGLFELDQGVKNCKTDKKKD